jgi:hypothetical protein
METSVNLSSSRGTILFVNDSGQLIGNQAQVTYTVSGCSGAG